MSDSAQPEVCPSCHCSASVFCKDEWHGPRQSKPQLDAPCKCEEMPGELVGDYGSHHDDDCPLYLTQKQTIALRKCRTAEEVSKWFRAL